MINITEYVGTLTDALFKWPWLDVNYVACRLGPNYSFTRSHSSYSDIKPHVVGSTSTLQNKSIVVDDDVTFIKCDQIEFTGDSIEANFIVIVAQPDGSVKDSDSLLCYINLDDKKAVNINKPILINDCGLIAIKRPSNA